MRPDAHQVKAFLLQLQDAICQKLSAVDGSEFIDFRSNCQKQASGEYEFDRLWQRWRLSTD